MHIPSISKYVRWKYILEKKNRKKLIQLFKNSQINGIDRQALKKSNLNNKSTRHSSKQVFQHENFQPVFVCRGQQSEKYLHVFVFSLIQRNQDQKLSFLKFLYFSNYRLYPDSSTDYRRVRLVFFSSDDKRQRQIGIDLYHFCVIYYEFKI